MFRTVEVALPIPLREPLSYAMPADGAPPVPGIRVLVPLGKRIVAGTIVRVQEDDAAPTRALKSVLEVLDDEPTFTPHVLELTRFVADYYCCGWGEVLQAALPSGLTPHHVMRVSLRERFDDESLDALERRAPRRAALLRLLQETKGDVSVEWLEKRLKVSSIADQLHALQQQGVIDVTYDVDQALQPRMVTAVRISPTLAETDEALKQAFTMLDQRAPKQSLALSHLYIAWMRGVPEVPRAEVMRELDISVSSIDALVKHGYAQQTQVEVGKLVDEEGAHTGPDESTLPLDDEQRRAVDALIAQIDRAVDTPTERSRTTLLHGVTGSGKTIVYQRVIAHALHRGRTALVIVPEISLTPQLTDRFRRVFGERVSVLHSRMSLRERVNAWRRIRSGETPIVIGARSAIFAPLDDLGVIIVDEEHESSYKQDDPAPRYHARDTAVMRGHLARCPVVLGSATPSLESIHHARSGRYDLLTLSTRADNAVLPSITLVDMRAVRKVTPRAVFSPQLLDAIATRIQRGEGTLVFLNRRGFSAQIQCEDCGDVPMCPNCDVALTYHKSGSALRCHYCGFSEPMRTSCHVCGSTELRDTGLGTQQVEETLTSLLAERSIQARVERMDTDTTSRRGAHRSMLRRFNDGDIDILVGTQMIAKGLDIPRVTLVGVVNADQQLFRLDFRAAERTVQLLVQVSGRAGRHKDHPGEVIIQTSSPDHAALVAAHTQNLDPWITDELHHRMEAGYPPYARFHVIECSGTDEQVTDIQARILEKLLPERTEYMERLPAIAPPIPRIRNRYRRVIVIKNDRAADPSGHRCRDTIRRAVDSYQAEYATNAVRVTVDIDASGSL